MGHVTAFENASNFVLLLIHRKQPSNVRFESELGIKIQIKIGNHSQEKRKREKSLSDLC